MNSKSADRVGIGTWAKVTGFVPGEEEVFHIVQETEADILENKIPPSSPLAKALDGTKPGDRIVFRPPAGRVELTVLEVGRQEQQA